MKKVERTTAEDGSVSEEVDDYPKVFIGEVIPLRQPHWVESLINEACLA